MVGAPLIYETDYIFVHVPKTAGQAITQALGGKTPSIETHRPLWGVEKGDRFAFGFMRNPWERMVSLYRFMCQKTLRDTDSFDQKAVREMGFRRWLMEDRFFMQEDRLTDDLKPMQRRPQMWWLEGCDFIGRVENLDRDFRTALSRIGLAPKTPSRVNCTKGGDWHAEYDLASIGFVALHFAADIEAFGYRCA